MIKGKKILSILTTVAMAGSILGSSFANSVTVFAKTNNTSTFITKNNSITKNTCQKLNKSEDIYNVPKFLGSSIPTTGIGESRLSGKNRYETAANIAEAGWTGTSEYAIIATGEDFPDALCAAPLASKYDAPIILTDSSSLNDNAKKELLRLQVENVIIVGGCGAVSQNTENSIKSLGINITRIYGKTRYETSEKIAEEIGPSSNIVLATGNNFPDALSIAAIAGMDDMPILLTDLNSIPAETLAYLNTNKTIIKNTYVVGGTGVISNTVYNTLKNPKRLAGNNRYETNSAIIKNFSSDLNSGYVYISTGKNFPDALACSALAPCTESPIILADEKSEGAAQTYITGNIASIGTVVAIGGTGAVSDTVLYNAANNYGKVTDNSVVASPFKDANLERAVRDTLNKPTGNFLKRDFNKVVFLNAANYKLIDITGIDKLSNLVKLNLENTGRHSNCITDITPIKGLTRLKSVNLCGNLFTDISALSNLYRLNDLNLSYSIIQDISAINGLTRLKKLNLGFISSINDYSGLKGLSKLQYLNLGTTNINNLNIISGLTNLHTLILNSIGLSDLSSLEGLKNLKELDLNNNMISDINNLQNLTNLKKLNLCNNQVYDTSSLQNLVNLKELNLNQNTYSDISNLKNLVNLKELDLNATSIINFNEIVNFSNLKKLAFSYDYVDDISLIKQLKNLNSLSLSCTSNKDLSLISSLTNLTELNLYVNETINADILKNLINLRSMEFYCNGITNINSLSSLTNLQSLSLPDAQISDISSLGTLKNLVNLDLDTNMINNISALKGLTNLKSLNLYNNQIGNIDALKNLTNLSNLYLDSNKISSIDALKILTNLSVLNLEGNQISSLDVLKGLTNLSDLDLSNNQINSIDALKSLTNLRLLILYNAKITDAAKQALKTALPYCSIYF